MLGSNMYCIKSMSPTLFHQKKLNCVVSATVMIRCQNVHTIKEREELKRCYKILNLPHDCDQEQLRSSFLTLVKKYHPDSGSPEANAAKFQEIEAAYRIVQNNFSKQRWDLMRVGGEYGLYHSENSSDSKESVKEFDIKHTAPQHRQYLSFGGVGYGTPQQRQKQYQKYRAAVAIENLYDHRVGKLRGKSEEDSLIIQDKKAAKKIKTRYGMERLVEDLIQESMAQGEFDNLSGKGKPLPQAADNPYVDFVTHKINQVLIDNGFVPEWISLQKEIREEAGKIREMLTKSRERLGLLPLTAADERLWDESLQKVQPLVKQLNIKINKYNLVVPLMKKQMLLFKLEREADQILQQVQPRQDQKDMDDEEKPFAAERAKTGRASCKRCKGKLESGLLRVARLVPNPFGSDGSKMKAWHHVTCLFDALSKARATTRKIESPEDDIEGWDLLADEDKAEIEKHMQEASAATPAKKPKKAPAKTESPAKRSEAVAKTKNNEAGAASTTTGKGEDKHSHRDHSFRQFRQICAQLADTPAYLEKSALLRQFFAKGSNGDGFQGDLALWIRMLLPDAKKRVYNLQSRQIIKLFSRILSTDLDEMMEDLNNGDVANTVKLFFEQSAHCQPHVRSTLTMQEVDSFLAKLAAVRTEDEQSNYFSSIVKRCTANDLMMIIRLIKHDLRINARAAHILDGLHEDAYKAYQNSRDLDAVVAQVQELQRPDGKTSGNLTIGISLMTPVLPMLAEVCKSVDQAMSRCPNGMFSEVKYDGERVQLHKRGKEFKFFSRSLKPVVPHKVKHFEEFIPKAFPHGRDLILDSEVLLIDTVTNKPLPFGTLGVHKKAAFQHATVCLFVFDCLYYNGEVLLDRSLKERRKILRDNMTEVPNHVVFSEIQEIRDKRDLEAMIARVLSEGLEGLVLKDIKSIYEPGKRHWLKVKKDYLCGGKMADTADLVPLGAWFGTGSKGGMMSVFLMCCWDPVRKLWLSVTKVHGGFDDQELQKLQTELEMDRINKDIEQVPHWLRLTKTHVPDFIAKDPMKMPVWEITGAEFTKHDAHTAGISVRFPRVTRVRDDKSYKEATNLQELRVLFENSRQGDASEYASLLSADAGGPSTSKKPLQKTASSPNKSPSKNPTSLVKTGSMDKFVKRKEKNDETVPKKPAPDSPKKAKKRPASPAPSDASAMRSGVVKKPFPDVFTKVHMVIPEWASSRHEQLARYFIAYGGDLLTGRRTLSATHLLFDDAHPPRLQMAGVKWVTCHWLWDSIREQKLLPVERYAPKISN